jgi:hypothetical protein
MLVIIIDSFQASNFLGGGYLVLPSRLFFPAGRQCFTPVTLFMVYQIRQSVLPSAAVLAAMSVFPEFLCPQLLS